MLPMEQPGTLQGPGLLLKFRRHARVMMASIPTAWIPWWENRSYAARKIRSRARSALSGSPPFRSSSTAATAPIVRGAVGNPATQSATIFW
jgi:hypothetical protein